MFKLMTDSTADLPESYLTEHEIGCVHLSYILDEETYGHGKELSVKDFYDSMRAGKMPTTSQVNPEEAKAYFETLLEQDKEILYLSFSSGLSGTYNSARIAADDLMEERKDCKIMVVDTLAASLGEGLLVHKAMELRDAGKSMEEVADWVETHKQNLVHSFTVDDLFHLHRGGRVSKTAAVLGTLAGIKPVLHVDQDGHLVMIDKVRGRKKSLSALVDYMEHHVGSYRDCNNIIFISHGDALEDAQFVAAQVKERFGIDSFLINPVGPTIGAHSGPGTIALFFMGDER